MVTIGTKLNIGGAIASTGTVVGFWNNHERYRRHRVGGVYVVTNAGRVPVRLKRGTAYRLADGTQGVV